MKLTLLLLTLTLAGCSAVAEFVPSMNHCSDVTYERHGQQIDIKAKCTAPIG